MRTSGWWKRASPSAAAWSSPARALAKAAAVTSGLRSGERVVAQFDEDVLALLQDGGRVQVVN